MQLYSKRPPKRLFLANVHISQVNAALQYTISTKTPFSSSIVDHIPQINAALQYTISTKTPFSS